MMTINAWRYNENALSIKSRKFSGHFCSRIGWRDLSREAKGLIAEYLTALIFFTGAMLLAIVPPGIIFSGFSFGAFWLIFGGLILGVGINVTGLGTRIAVNGRRESFRGV